LVGDPMLMEWKGGKYPTVFRGAKPDRLVLAEIQTSSKEPTWRIDVPGFLLVDVPVVNGKAVIFEFNAPLNVRFLTEGAIYSFKTILARTHPKASLLVLEYPPTLLHHNLRTSERIAMMVLVEATLDGEQGSLIGAIIDISSNGAMLALEHQVDVGRQLLLKFLMPDGTPVTGITASVRNMRNQEEKFYAGVSFNAGMGSELQAVKNYYLECLKYSEVVHRV